MLKQEPALTITAKQNAWINIKRTNNISSYGARLNMMIQLYRKACQDSKVCFIPWKTTLKEKAE